MLTLESHGLCRRHKLGKTATQIMSMTFMICVRDKVRKLCCGFSPWTTFH